MVERRHRTFGGIKAEVVTEDQVTRGSPMLCMRRTIPLLEPENRVAPCAGCGDELQFHPSSPTGMRMLCMSCLAIEVLAAGEGGQAQVTEDQVAVIEAWLKRDQN